MATTDVDDILDESGSSEIEAEIDEALEDLGNDEEEEEVEYEEEDEEEYEYEEEEEEDEGSTRNLLSTLKVESEDKGKFKKKSSWNRRKK